VRTQNRELSFRCIAYNTHRITNLAIIIDGFYKAYQFLYNLVHISTMNIDQNSDENSALW
ncbi:MAG: hypothetical protein WAJ93_06800, partial [Candidatus Nitrosopolaris sp.]